MAPKAQTLVFKSFEELERGLRRELLSRVANGAFVEKVQRTADKAVQATVGVTIPRLVRDPQSQKGVFKFFHYSGVARIRFVEERGRLISEPIQRSAFLGGLVQKENDLLMRAERALIRSTKNRLVQIQPVGTGLNPIKELLIAVNEYDQVSLDEVGKHQRYVKLLQDLRFIRVEKGKIQPGPELEKYSLPRKRHESSHEFYDKLLGEVLEVGYTHLVEDLRILHLVPIVRTAHSYYWPSFNLGKPMTFEAKDFLNQLAKLYPRYHLPRMRLTTYLIEMDRAGILQKEGNTYTRAQPIWKDYSAQLGRIEPTLLAVP